MFEIVGGENVPQGDAYRRDTGWEQKAQRSGGRGGEAPILTRENWDFSVLLKERRENGTQKLREFL